VAEEIERSLRYIRTQLSLGMPLHHRVEDEIRKLEELDYPPEKLDEIREEFGKPVEERRPMEVAPLPEPQKRIRETIIDELESWAVEELGPNPRSREFISKIVDDAITREPDLKRAARRATRRVKDIIERARPPTVEEVEREVRREIRRLRG